jgi:hypothetical protein
VKYFCNARNTIQYIQDIKIINAFHNGVSDIKTVEEIDMKKPKMVVDLLAVTDTCIEAFEAQARLLESRGKGPAKKKQDDREVNMTDRGDRRGHGYHRNRQQLSSDRRRRCLFVTLMTQRSGARSITSQDTIWKSAKLFWIVRRYHCQQCRLPRSPDGVNIVGPIPPMMMNRWERST